VKQTTTPTIITIASSKGGVGKSTICISLAGELAKSGQNVHIIDLDENKTVLRWHTQHKVNIQGLTLSSAAPADFPAHLREVTSKPHDYVLIDVAGVYEKALLQAMGRSNLVIIPAQPSEPDIHEATKIIRDLTDLNDSFNGNVPYRLLLNLFDPLDPQYQRHAVDEISRLKLNRFNAVVHKRAAYREVFFNGLPPHFADGSRDAVRKAVAEIDTLAAEIQGVLMPIKGEGAST
jgi:chromosome partitioning protein